MTLSYYDTKQLNKEIAMGRMGSMKQSMRHDDHSIRVRRYQKRQDMKAVLIFLIMILMIIVVSMLIYINSNQLGSLGPFNLSGNNIATVCAIVFWTGFGILGKLSYVVIDRIYK